MGILDRFRKKSKKEKDVTESLSREKLKEILNLMFEKTDAEKSSYLNKLNKDELRAVLNELDEPFKAPRDFAFSDFEESTTSLGYHFPIFKRLVKDALKKKKSEENIEKVKKILPPPGFKITEKSETSSDTLSKLKQVFKEQIPREEEIRLEKQESLQMLVNKLCLWLADFWGIPRSKISGKIPRVMTYSKEDWEGLEKEIPITGFFGKDAGPFKNTIVVNEEYLAKEFQSGILNIKSALAEEVCHFLEDFVKSELGIKTGDVWEDYVTEFFGLISRFYISELVPELFREEYRKYLRRAINFSNEMRNVEQRINKTMKEAGYYDKILKYPKNVKKAWVERIKKHTLDDYKEALEIFKHLSYYPAAAYYYEIKKLSPAVRYQLLRRSSKAILAYIIYPQEKKLEIIRNKILERQERMANLRIEQTPETGQFFERVAEKAGYEEYGRTGEPLPPEEQEQYIGIPTEVRQKRPPKIVISVPGKLSKKAAKKLRSLKISIPKKLVRKTKK